MVDLDEVELSKLAKKMLSTAPAKIPNLESLERKRKPRRRNLPAKESLSQRHDARASTRDHRFQRKLHIIPSLADYDR